VTCLFACPILHLRNSRRRFSRWASHNVEALPRGG
jgi:hypothetical protein